jgi:hypothetical protein
MMMFLRLRFEVHYIIFIVPLCAVFTGTFSLHVPATNADFGFAGYILFARSTAAGKYGHTACKGGRINNGVANFEAKDYSSAILRIQQPAWTTPFSPILNIVLTHTRILSATPQKFSSRVLHRLQRIWYHW